MKYIFMFFVLIVLVSCNNNATDLDLPLLTDPPVSKPPLSIQKAPPETAYFSSLRTPGNWRNIGFGVINIDGCKYVFIGEPWTLTHAGNCHNHGNVRAEK